MKETKKDRRRKTNEKINISFCRARANKVGLMLLHICLLLSAWILITCPGCSVPARPTGAKPDRPFLGNLVTEAKQIIREGLTDVNPGIRIDAIEAVAVTRQIRLMPVVERMLGDELGPVRFAAALAIGDSQYSLAKTNVPKLLQDDDENVRLAAAYAMYKLGSKETLQTIRKAIANNNQTVRANAALLLGKSGNTDALKLLWWTMERKDSDYMVSLKAAEAIARLGDERILTKLWATVYSAYVDDRIMAIRAMGALGTAKAQDILITKLKDEVLEVRLTAAEQLGSLANPAGESVVAEVFMNKLTARVNAELRVRINVRAAIAIGQIRTDRLKKFLPVLLRDKSRAVRLAAAKAILECLEQTGEAQKSSI